MEHLRLVWFNGNVYEIGIVFGGVKKIFAGFIVTASSLYSKPHSCTQTGTQAIHRYRDVFQQ